MLALRRGRHWSVLAARGRLVDECRYDGTARHRRSSDGEAVKIFDAWFGPQSQEPMQRKFKIQAD
jgi:hypothetical protein